MTDRTVLDVLTEGLGVLSGPCAVELLGVDPDMPFDQFQRWLRYGQRVEELRLSDRSAKYLGSYRDPFYAEGWMDCLSASKETP